MRQPAGHTPHSSALVQKHTRPAPTSHRHAKSTRPGILLTSLGLLPLVLGSCSSNDPKAASKENFTQAITAWQVANPDRNKVCQQINVGVSSGTEFIFADITPKGSDLYNQLDGLHKLGYLTMQESALGGLAGVKIGTTPKYIQTFGAPGESINKTVCVGKSTLDHIDDFTEPSEVMGLKVSQVEATDKQTVTADLPWMKDAALAKLVAYTSPPATKKVVYTMVLKDSGWAVDSVR